MTPAKNNYNYCCLSLNFDVAVVLLLLDLLMFFFKRAIVSLDLYQIITHFLISAAVVSHGEKYICSKMFC